MPEQSIDDIVRDFMNSTDLPVMFIKKPNGGDHTARNAAHNEARGKFIANCDSDDEFMPEACQYFVDAWDSVPEAEKYLYWGAAFPIVNEKGQLVGKLFPEGINSMTWEEADKAMSRLPSVDRQAFIKAEILKVITIPVPEGVTFASEVIFWSRMPKIFREYRVNKIALICHTEGDDHLSRPKLTLQNIKNDFFNIMYRLNMPRFHYTTFPKYCRHILRYRLLERIIKSHDPEFVKRLSLEGRKNKFWYAMMRLPSKIALPLYKWRNRKRMSL